MLAKLVATALLRRRSLQAEPTLRRTSLRSPKRCCRAQGQRLAASKLVGVNAYEASEKVGDINDVILDRIGKAENVILGVRGLFGHGRALCCYRR
jgi:hypothetical protein